MDLNVRALLEPKKNGKTKKISGSQINSPTSFTSTLPLNEKRSQGVPAYDPRALLNPKGARTQPASTTSRRSHQPNMSESTAPPMKQDASGPRSMIEDLYSVEQRAERPMKRVKLSPSDESTSKSKMTSRTGPGIIGDYMRPDPNDLKPIAISDLVDLTNDDDTHDSDDDVKLVKAVNVANEQEVCFGGLWTMVHAHAVPKPSKTAFPVPDQWPLIRCTLHRVPSDNTIIEVQDPEGFVFGRIAPDMAAVLAPIMDALRRITTQARLSNRPKHNHEWPHQPCSGHMKMNFNLFGRRGDAEKVGKILGQHNIWLRTPLGVSVGTPIANPHEKQKVMLAQNPVNKGVHHHLNDNRTIEEATQAVTKLFDHYANTAKPLAETEPPAVIVSPLLSHQKQALTFMLSKESPRTFGPNEEDNSSLWRKKIRMNGAVSYEELVSGIHVKEEPEQVYGGLLADVMGLGKTLEALSLVATTMGEAHQFSRQNLVRADNTESILMAQSRATLIVAPVSTVKNWEDQLAEHMKPGAIKYCVYHGTGREKNLHKLADFDIVISTYGTISAECSKRRSVLSPLQQIRWFRIILDEAHTIREPKASQSQAMYGLAAERRWCLTGTPIQNRIDDLGSLTRFLRLYPYDSTARFQQYVKGPAVSGKDPNHLKSLRIFVDSFTLRRLKDKVNLPKRQDLVEKLDFSPEEQQIYDFFKNISKAQIKEVEDKRAPIGKSSGLQHSQVLRGIMTLRLISAHGRELLKENDLEKLRGMTPQEAIDLDDVKVPTLTERTAYESLSLLAEAGIDMCKNCDKRIGSDSPQEEEANAGTRAYVLPCLDVVCSDCFSAFKANFDMMGNGHQLDCPYCTLRINAQYVPINKPIDEVLEMQPSSPTNHEYKKGDYGGLHTKTKALLADLYQMHVDSQEFEERGEPPLKCVVFSEFTSHLDLIQRALDDHGWKYLRIDGTMSLAKRGRVLDGLNNNNEARILLASIKAAGQGLNLTVASRAFIMEPLWNPAAEAQAVDRIYRIGQKREVMVKRYQMKDSIELAVVKLQIKKQKMADFTVNKNHQALSKKQTREDHIKELLELFK